MKLITERVRIRGVADAWREQYADWPKGRVMASGTTPAEIQARLDALDPETATAADVDEAIGTSGGAAPPTCDECGTRDGRAVVELGQEPDYDSHTAWVCLPRLRAAVALGEEVANG